MGNFLNELMLVQDSLELAFDFETVTTSYADGDSGKIIVATSDDDA